MSNRVRARVRQGKFEPLEPIDLPEGKEVILKISASRRKIGDGIRRSAGTWRNFNAEVFIQDLYAARGAHQRSRSRR